MGLHHQRPARPPPLPALLRRPVRPGRSAIGTETVPTYPPGDIRTLAAGRVLVIHRNLLPILARTVDVTKRADWAQLRRDTTAVRAGQVPVDAAGRLHRESAAS